MTINAQPAQGYAGDITPTEAYAALRDSADSVLIDVRTPLEWDTIGVPDVSATGARLCYIPWLLDGEANPAFLAQLEAVLDDAPEPSALIFLCRSGARSAAAARAATGAGLAPSYNVQGGFEGNPGPSGERDIEGWKVDGLPWGFPSDATENA
jgi:rhodanese-related sulfurtransferase